MLNLKVDACNLFKSVTMVRYEKMFVVSFSSYRMDMEWQILWLGPDEWFVINLATLRSQW